MRDVAVLSSSQMKSIQGLVGNTLEQSVLSTIELQRMKDTASGEIERRAAAARNAAASAKAEGFEKVGRAVEPPPLPASLPPSLRPRVPVPPRLRLRLRGGQLRTRLAVAVGGGLGSAQRKLARESLPCPYSTASHHGSGIRAVRHPAFPLPQPDRPRRASSAWPNWSCSARRRCRSRTWSR